MPTVQRREREISTAPIPGVRKTTGGSAIAEGAGVEQAKANVGEEISQLGGRVAAFGVNAYADIVEESRRRADSVAILEAERKLSQWENKKLYDPQTGALNVRGKDAMGLPEGIDAEFESVAGQIEKGLGTDRQREAFARVRMQRGSGLSLTIQRHVREQMNVYEGEELKATVENAHESAIANALDPERVDAEIDRAVGAIRHHAPRLGLGPEAIEKQIAGVTSSTHAGVIDRLIQSDKAEEAQIYFDKNKAEITGEQLTKTEKNLEEGSLRSQSQKEADRIFAAGGTETQQLAEAAKIANPKLRDETEARIEHRNAVKERADREVREERTNSAYDVIDKTGDWTKIPASVWTDLPGSTRSAIKSYAEDKARGIPTKTNLKDFYGLTTMVGNKPDDFMKLDIYEYRNKLSESDFKQMAELQMRMRTGDTKAAEKAINGFRTNGEIWNGVLTSTKLDKDSQEANELHKEMDRRIDQFQQDTGKEATNEQKQAIADNLVGNVVLEPGGWGNILPGGKPFYDVTKKSYQIQIGDVPAGQRKTIEAKLKEKGLPVTPDSVVDFWLQTKRRLGEIK